LLALGLRAGRVVRIPDRLEVERAVLVPEPVLVRLVFVLGRAVTTA